MKKHQILILVMVLLALTTLVIHNPKVGILTVVGGIPFALVGATGITAPAAPNATGFAFAELTKIFRGKCRVYFAVGSWVTADTSIPTTKAANLVLRGTPYQPMGNMDKGVGEIKWKDNTVEIDFYEIPAGGDLTVNVNSIRMSADFMLWLTTAEAASSLSLLFVPDGDDGSVYLAVAGVTITKEIILPLNGDLGICKLNISKKGIPSWTSYLKYNPACTA